MIKNVENYTKNADYKLFVHMCNMLSMKALRRLKKESEAIVYYFDSIRL